MKRLNNSGFTVSELVVVMTLTLLLSTLLFSFVFDLWGGTGSLQNRNDTLVERQNIGDSLRNRLNVASSLLNQNSIPDQFAEVPEPSDGSGLYWLLMHAEPNPKIEMPASGQYVPILYYQAPAVDAAKHFIMRGVEPHQDEFILYLNGTTKQLILRVLPDTTAAGNALQATCPAAQSEANGCAPDKVLASDVSFVGKKFFSKSGNVINWKSVEDPDAPGTYIGPDNVSVEVVELTIGFNKRAIIQGRSDDNSQTTIRVALRNG